jgi:hypothetical protein
LHGRPARVFGAIHRGPACSGIADNARISEQAATKPLIVSRAEKSFEFSLGFCYFVTFF